MANKRKMVIYELGYDGTLFIIKNSDLETARKMYQ